jgi:dephospho-CoA kinase
MIVIGLTGGPGTGKSLAASYLERKGAKILSGDQSGRRAVDEHPAVLRNLVKAFGSEILNSNRTLNRRKLGSIAFSDIEAHRTLNQIVHPQLLKILRADLKTLNKNAKSKLAVIDAALIFEWGIADWCDYILVVTANRDIRLKRLVAQGLSRHQAEDRIRSQIPDRDKIALADYVIKNNGTRSGLRKEINKFLKLLP